MDELRSISKRAERPALAAIALLFVGISIVGITWGLPSRSIDKYLFGDAEPWSGEKIYRLAGAADKFSPTRGADVDVDPLDTLGDEPILLTGTEEDVAKIYLRYRLYTYQPDEMITMMALAGMNPRQIQFDPRLYQYGGLFVYPVGGLIGVSGLLGLIDVRGDVVFYLDNPDEFGKFYIVARAYSAAWGLVGLFVVFAIGRRLSGSRAGLLAALLFTLMPVVVCMAHEGKPHLPGAVLMLMAVLFGMRHLSCRAACFSLREDANGDGSTGTEASRKLKHAAQEKRAGRDFRLMCICCGAALGMVLSSWPIFVLIPLVVWLESRAAGGIKSRLVGSPRDAASCDDDTVPIRFHWLKFATRVAAGVLGAVAVYVATNPYILINAVTNRDVLASNFGNSFAMYQITRVWEGFVRVLELTVEGASLPVLVLGVVALLVALLCSRAMSRRLTTLPLAIAAIVFFLQFVLIGAGKPAEYGRFGIFSNTALAIGAACLLTRRWINLREVVNWIPAATVCVWIAGCSAAYLGGFVADTTGRASRLNLARFCAEFSRDDQTGHILPRLATLAEPAPYCFPPIDFARAYLQLIPIQDCLGLNGCDEDVVLLCPLDRSERLVPKYAEMLHHEPILFSPMFRRDLRGDPILLGLDPWWRSVPPTRLDHSAIWQTVSMHSPMSWANKPFYDSVFRYLTTDEPIPLGR